MATFDLFPYLPCELRLEIWRFAIRPVGRGIHRFSIVTDKTAKRGGSDKKKKQHAAAAPRVVPDAPGSGSGSGPGSGHGAVAPGSDFSWTRGNDSTYLWDAGLWTACRESRDVMAWHFRTRHWDEARRRLLRSPGQWTPAALADEFQDMTAMTTARAGDGDVHLMMQPHKDLFWLEPRDWTAAVEWHTLFLDLPFASSRRGYGQLSHVAVEHDASWNLDLPKDLGALTRESTPRGFIARAMAECATNKLYCYIWLVDRTLVRRRKTEEKQGPAERARGDGDSQEAGSNQDGGDDDCPSSLMTFYDCKRVYVDTDRADLAPLQYDAAADFDKTALRFVQQLGTIGNADYSLMGGEADDFDFCVEEYLGVLACA